MKIALPLAAVLLPAATVLAQNTGTSHPEALNDVVVTSTAQTSTHYEKPSPAVPMAADQSTAPALRTREYTTTTPTSVTATSQTTVSVPRASAIVRDDADDDTFVVTDDVNSGVVTDVPWRENEVPEGTVLHARLSTEISTDLTEAGTPFKARLTSPVEHRGRIILPIGSVISGRVTDLHGGRRISGPALIHLQPDMVTLPDGTTHRLTAQVIDLVHSRGTHVNNEGTIVGNDPSKGTLAALGLTTGSAAVAGAVIGGGVGAAVGAGIGAGVGTIWWLKRENHQTLAAGTEVVFGLNRPMVIESYNQ